MIEKIVPYVYNALKYSNFILKHLSSIFTLSGVWAHMELTTLWKRVISQEQIKIVGPYGARHKTDNLCIRKINM